MTNVGLPSVEPTPVFFVAGGTGISAETLGNAILRQFPSVHFVRHKFPFITSDEQANAAVALMDAAKTNAVTPLVFSTCGQESVRGIIATSECEVVDLFGTHLASVERVLHVNASRVAGSAHGLGNQQQYDARMQAIEFAMEHDDGQSLRALDKAEVILTAPSRCGKTPTTMYLALQHGLRVANYPLVDEDFSSTQLPDPIRPYAGRLVGLLTTPQRLSQVRNERRPGSRYSSIEQCQYELRRAESMFKANRIPSVNSSSKSVEEMAAVILQTLKLEPAN